MSPPGQPLRLAVLISGTGSNLKTLIDARAEGRLDIDLVLVISNRADAPGLAHARAANIPVEVISPHDLAPGQLEDEAVGARLEAARPDLVLLSGYMRILGAPLVEAFHGRMINQHPSLLPRHKGLDTYQRALDAGDRNHGASVHFVTAELDGGPVITQASVPVLPGDNATRLAARLRPVEHRLLIATVELFTRGRVRLDSDTVRLDDKALNQPLDLTDALRSS